MQRDDETIGTGKKNPVEALNEMEENIKSREDLAEFVWVLLEDYKKGNLPEQPLTEYVGGLYGLIEALDGWHQNVFSDEPFPEQPDWRWMGRIIHAAFYHS